MSAHQIHRRSAALGLKDRAPLLHRSCPRFSKTILDRRTDGLHLHRPTWGRT
jgi:hypothetical protein